MKQVRIFDIETVALEEHINDFLTHVENEEVDTEDVQILCNNDYVIIVYDELT